MIRIFFQDENGRPLAGAVVAITAAPAEMTDIGYITDDQGSVALTLPMSGTYRFALTDAAGERTSAKGQLPVSGEARFTARNG